jgi:cytochrome P450
MEAVSRPRLYSAERGSVVIADMGPAQLEMFRQQLISMDPPKTRVQARIVAFTPRMMTKLEPRVRDHARDRRQDRARRECDFVTSVAAGCRCS